MSKTLKHTPLTLEQCRAIARAPLTITVSGGRSWAGCSVIEDDEYDPYQRRIREAKGWRIPHTTDWDWDE